MKMKRLTLALLLVLAVSVSACDSFLDINDDPVAGTNADGEALFPTIIANLASNNAIEYGPAQNFFTQYWSSGLSSGVFISPDRYLVSSFTTGNTWTDNYDNALRNTALVVQSAEQADPQRENRAAQAKILAGYVYLSLTEMWEDVPFTQSIIPPSALSDSADLVDPEFDRQKDVLQGTVSLVQEGLDQINLDSPRPGITDGDLIYNGDMEKWARFGRSIQLRANFLLQSGGMDRSSQLSTLMNEDLIRSNADNALLPFFDETNNANNVWKLYNQFGSGFLWCAKTTVDLMKANDDPRLPVFCEPNSVDEYVGVPNAVSAFSADTTLGTPPDSTDGEENYPFYSQVNTTTIIRRAFPSPMVTAAQVLLIEAEVAEQQNDPSTAASKYEAGVQASLDYYGSQPGANVTGDDEDAYLGSLDDLSSLSQDDALRTIHEQQYIALWDHQPAGWTNWRRTQVPDLPLPANAQLGNIIRRFPYPPDEASANGDNIPEQEALDNPMWFEDGQNENPPPTN